MLGRKKPTPLSSKTDSFMTPGFPRLSVMTAEGLGGRLLSATEGGMHPLVVEGSGCRPLRGWRPQLARLCDLTWRCGGPFGDGLNRPKEELPTEILQARGNAALGLIFPPASPCSGGRGRRKGATQIRSRGSRPMTLMHRLLSRELLSNNRATDAGSMAGVSRSDRSEAGGVTFEVINDPPAAGLTWRRDGAQGPPGPILGHGLLGPPPGERIGKGGQRLAVAPPPPSLVPSGSLRRDVRR